MNSESPPAPSDTSPRWLPRTAGILLHPTSLPGPFGNGDIGPSARAWVDFLADAGLSVWQILPLSPTGYGDSPYQCLSDFAGNTLLISLEDASADGLLTAAEVSDHPPFPEGAADFEGTFSFKTRLFQEAYRRLLSGSVPRLQDEYRQYRESEKAWLDDFGLFLALKRAHQGRPWWEWDKDLGLYHPEAVRRAREALGSAVEEIAFEQFLFARQWAALRRYARERGISILGDLPVFCALDSVDVWSAKENFQLDGDGRPTVMAGVPPDYISRTGQLWGNPIFRWDVLQSDGFAWWIRRARAALRWSDIVRLDHFRGYVKYWAVPAGRSTAEVGWWMPGPGEELFQRLRESLGGMPFVAEDLGVITRDVIALRERFELPGMRVLQFAFDGERDNPFLPHRYTRRTVVYTGTHDNDTTAGWYRSLTPEERTRVDRYRGKSEERGVAWDFLRLAWASVAETAVCPLQDVLELGSEARMNYPGRPEGNWRWRFRRQDLHPELSSRLRDLTDCYGRLPVAGRAREG
jgi:4-alpha-glucanotransferase